MRASELIALLGELRARHGDLPVTAMIDDYGNGLGEITSAELALADDPANEWGFPQNSFMLT